MALDNEISKVFVTHLFRRDDVIKICGYCMTSVSADVAQLWSRRMRMASKSTRNAAK